MYDRQGDSACLAARVCWVICSFHLNCQMYWHRFGHNIFALSLDYISESSAKPSIISDTGNLGVGSFSLGAYQCCCSGGALFACLCCWLPIILYFQINWFPPWSLFFPAYLVFFSFLSPTPKFLMVKAEVVNLRRSHFPCSHSRSTLPLTGSILAEFDKFW